MTHWRKHVVTLASGGVLAALAVVAPVATAGPAAFTSVDEGIDGTGHCVHGNPAVNCNAYDGKEFVWLNGGPLTAVLGDGNYFFAVVNSGGQSDPNDGTPNLLSSDSFTERSFSVTNCATSCVFTYLGSTHDVDGTKIRLIPYGDAAHVYHLMICRLADDLSQPSQKSCKSDAFKVTTSGGGGGGGFSAPTADKTADGNHHKHITWTIAKSADQTVIHSGSPVATHYTVTATKHVDSETWGVSGIITVTNTNTTPLPVTNVVENLATDEPSLGASCTVGPPTSGSVPAASGQPPVPGTLDFPYSCSLANQPDYSATYLNSATVTYTDDQQASQTVDAVMTFTVPAAATLDSGSDPESVVVKDDNPGTALALSGTGTTISDTTVWNYTINWFNNLCVDHTNTATMSTTDSVQPTGWPRTAQWTVTFCGPNAGGLTQGWWQNKNGQALLKANTSSACTTLNGYVGGNNTLADLINVDSGGNSSKQYVNGDCTNTSAFSYLPKFDLFVFNLANSSGTGWPMLLSQWLTTTLDTASYPNTIKAGGPSLTGAAKIYNPDGLLGLPTCTTIHDLLAGAVTQFSSYKNTKSTVTALSSMFDRINNNIQPSCV
jgi:hypothetical protein